MTGVDGVKYGIDRLKLLAAASLVHPLSANDERTPDMEGAYRQAFSSSLSQSSAKLSIVRLPAKGQGYKRQWNM